MTARFLISLVLVFVCSLAIAGDPLRINMQNYNKVKLGDPEAWVVRCLGQAQGLALAGHRHERPVGLAVDDHQVNGVGADIEHGQAHRQDPFRGGDHCASLEARQPAAAG